MIFIFGKRYTKIGKYIDNEHICYPCKAYDKEILVHRSYFHFCLIPVFPMGPRQFEIRCRNCGDETKSESIVNKYKSKSKTPIYFYSAWLLFASVTLIWFIWNKNDQKHKMEAVTSPLIGDVFNIKQIKNEETSYYFLRIIGTNGDSIFAIHNDLYYSDFVNHLDKDDYFVKDDTVIYKRKRLKEMLENDEIFSVSRNYSDEDGFNRIK
jgi:hypothetical protein